MDFATLKPANTVATGLLAKAIEFMHREAPAKLNLFVSSSDNDAEVGESVNLHLVGESYYLLSLADSKKPNNPGRGWIVGRSSETSETGPLKVDFLLAVPKQGTEAGIAPVNIIFKFNRSSGALTFTPSSREYPVQVLVENRFVQLPYGESRLVMERRTVLRLGKAEYELFFIVPRKNLDLYFDQLYEYLGKHTSTEPQQLIRYFPSPQGSRFDTGEACVSTITIGVGAFGRVSQGISYQGEALAIKVFNIKNRHELNLIRAEFDIASQLQKQKFLTGALKLWCHHDDSFQKECSECAERGFKTTLYMSFPLAQGSFNEMLTIQPDHPETDAATRLTLYHQTLYGLYELEKLGFMHRDVTVNNMLVISWDPPEASIADFGKTCKIRDQLEYDTVLGPISCVAPEVWSGEGYNQSIDLYSWALAIATLHAKPPAPWWTDGRVTPGLLEIFRERLERRARDPRHACFRELYNLLLGILEWRPVDRISVLQALLHPCWQDRLFPTDANKKIRIEETSSEETNPGKGQREGGNGSSEASTEAFSSASVERDAENTAAAWVE